MSDNQRLSRPSEQARSQQDRSTQDRPGLAIAWFLASIGLISVIDTICKRFTAELSAVELVWGYFLGIFLTLCVYFTVRRQPIGALLRTKRPVLQGLRAGFLVGSIVALFIGLTYLPIAETAAIGFTAPLFMTALSVPVLRERVGAHRWIAVIAGLIGVMIIVRPGGGLWHWAATMPLIGAVFFAAFQLTTRMLANNEDNNTTLFYTGLAGLFWISLLAPFYWTTPTALHWLVFIGTGAMGAMAHLCFIKAFALAQASFLAPFNYSKLIWVAGLGYLVFGDVPSLNMWLGSGLIALAGAYVLYRETKARGAKNDSGGKMDGKAA